MERETVIKALECFHQRILDTDLAKNIYEAEIMAIINASSLIDDLAEENDRLSTALAEYEHKTNIRISEEYVHNEAYEELREENKKLIAEAENYKKIAEYQQNISMDRHFEIKRLNKENERLKEKADRNLENLKAVLEERNENTIVADTVKKMQERLREAFNFGHTILEKSICDIIDQIAKEMLEEE